MTQTDQTVPEGAWAFTDNVALVFNDMLARSIPGYGEMRRVVSELGRRFISEPGRIVDLGASRGEAVASLLAGRPDAEALAIEIAPGMAAAARERLSRFPRARVEVLDLRRGYPALAGVDVVLAVLTLQFVPIEHRYRILSDAYRSLRPGGALILVEKVLAGSPDADALLVETYLDRKREHGYSDEQIDRKRLALEGVLVPLTGEANERMLASAGFAPVERVWQTLNFAGWLALR